MADICDTNVDGKVQDDSQTKKGKIESVKATEKGGETRTSIGKGLTHVKKSRSRSADGSSSGSSAEKGTKTPKIVKDLTCDAPKAKIPRVEKDEGGKKGGGKKSLAPSGPSNSANLDKSVDDHDDRFTFGDDETELDYEEEHESEAEEQATSEEEDWDDEDEEDPQKSASSGSESEDSESGSVRSRTSSKVTPRASSPDSYSMFDPEKEQRAQEVRLSATQSAFVRKNFSNYLKEEVLREQILKKDPVPNNEALQVPETDQEVLDMITYGSKEVKAVDSSFTRIQKKVVNIMGPLGACWKRLYKIRKSGGKTCNLDEFLSLVEKSVLLVGQAHVTISYQRRLNLLIKAVGDSKQASEILKTYEEKLGSTKTLFGSAFMKSLLKKAKSHKEGQQIRHSLGSKRTDRRFRGSTKYGRGKPFRQGAPRSAFREGQSHYSGHYSTQNQYQSRFQHKKTQKRGAQGGGRRYVTFVTSKMSVETGTNGRSRSEQKARSSSRVEPSVRSRSRADSLQVPRAPDSHTHARSSVRTRSKSCPGGDTGTSGRQTQVLCRELGENYSRSMGSKQCSGSPSRDHGDSSAKSSTTHPQILRERIRVDFGRGRQVTGQGCDKESTALIRSVCGAPVLEAQKRRVNETSFQSSSIECLDSVPAFQDGRDEVGRKPVAAKRLSLQDRHERCVLLSAYCS